MGNTNIIQTIIDHLNSLSQEEQQEILEFSASVVQRRRESEQFKAAQAEAQAVLNGPFRSAEESRAAFLKKFNLPAVAELSEEATQAKLDAEFATFSPEKIAKLKQSGLI